MSLARIALASLCALFLLGACTKTSDEDLIRERVRAALTAVNEKKAGDVVEHAHETFKGPRSMDLRQTRRIIAGYLLTSGWIRAFERKLDVQVTGDEAHVDLEVVLAKGQQIKSIKDVVPTNGSVLDVDLDLQKHDGEWRFVSGDYKQMKW